MSIEIERKYIISMPDFELLSSLGEYTRSEILQIYLESDANVTHRVRRRVFADHTVYTETKKIRIDKMSAIEDEGEISAEEFVLLSQKQKEGTRALNKTRHTFDFGGFCFEIDVYPEWKHSAIMEVELENKDVCFSIPPFIRVIEEVTGNKAYSNASMARSFPEESTV